MKWAVFLLLAGCAPKASQLTIFLKEKTTRIYRLDGKDCLASGYLIVPAHGGGHRLVTVFENCDVRHERLLDEVEIKQWIKPPT